jgi:hypothetical protein
MTDLLLQAAGPSPLGPFPFQPPQIIGELHLPQRHARHQQGHGGTDPSQCAADIDHRARRFTSDVGEVIEITFDQRIQRRQVLFTHGLFLPSSASC